MPRYILTLTQPFLQMVISQFRNKDVQEKLEGQYLRARNISTLKTCSKLFDALFFLPCCYTAQRSGVIFQYRPKKWEKTPSQNSVSSRDPDFTLNSQCQHLKLWRMAEKNTRIKKNPYVCVQLITSAVDFPLPRYDIM